MTFPDSLEARVQGGHLALAKQRLSNYIQKVKMKGYTSAPSALSPDNHRENFFFFFGLFRAAPSAYGDSQARGQTRAATAGLCHSHSNAGSELCLQPVPDP